MIRNMAKYHQFMSFDNLVFGSIHPSDIDCVLEFQNRLAVIVECKSPGVELSLGQKILLERLCDRLERGGMVCVIIVANNGVSDLSAKVDVASMVVRYLRRSGKWVYPSTVTTVRGAIDGLLKELGIRIYIPPPKPTVDLSGILGSCDAAGASPVKPAPKFESFGSGDVFDV